MIGTFASARGKERAEICVSDAHAALHVDFEGRAHRCVAGEFDRRAADECA